MRTCVGCRRRAAVHELQRCALACTGELVVSASAPGRGAWICRGSTRCVDRAIAGRRFDRAFRRTVAAPVVTAFREAFAHTASDMRESTTADGATTTVPPVKG